MRKEISQPSTMYKSPKAISLYSDLSNKQKRTALLNWKQTCIQLQESTSEGMIGKNQSENLKLVLKELSILKKLQAISIKY